MKLIQLRYLVAVAENELHITQAARTLHAAQPGVSYKRRTASCRHVVDFHGDVREFLVHRKLRPEVVAVLLR